MSEGVKRNTGLTANSVKHAKPKFQEALQDRELSPSTITVIQEANTSVRAGHDRASQMKHSLENS